MKTKQKMVLVACVLLVMMMGLTLVGCKNDSVPETAGSNDSVPEIAGSQVGYIAYSDGSISSNYDSSKTPVGIVFDVDETGAATKIVALTEAKKIWSTEEDVETFTKFYFKDATEQSNMEIIKNIGGDDWENKYPAFAHCANYGETSSYGGGWYLPYCDELRVLNQVKDKVNDAIEKLSKDVLTVQLLQDESPYWSSSEFDMYEAWCITLNKNKDWGDQQWYKKSSEQIVRPIRFF